MKKFQLMNLSNNQSPLESESLSMTEENKAFTGCFEQDATNFFIYIRRAQSDTIHEEEIWERIDGSNVANSKD